MSFGLGIDKDLPTPAYLQLKEQLANAIDSGQLASGSALPSERGLASSLGLSRMTVRRAFEQLVEAGLVEQRQGSGTYVRGQALEQFIDRVLSFGDEARNLGFDPGTRMVESHLQPAEEAEAAALKVPLGSQILRINRLRTADGEPLAIQEAHLPPHLAELSIELLDRTGSLYRSLVHSLELIQNLCDRQAQNQRGVHLVKVVTSTLVDERTLRHRPRQLRLAVSDVSG